MASLSMTRRRPPSRSAMATRDRGVSMLFALMTLVALSLAAVSLVRSVDTGALILGNMGFKEDTVLASDEATRRATDYVVKGQKGIDGLSLEASIPNSGFYVNAMPTLDVTGSSKKADRIVVDWKMDGCSDQTSGSYAQCLKPVNQAIKLPNGVWARYVVTMMCTDTGGASADCLGPTTQKSNETSESGALSYPDPRYAKSSATSVYYRIVVRTEGARNAVSFTETIAHNYSGEEAAAK